MRDALLGRLDHDTDLDFTTNAQPEQIVELLDGWAEAVWDVGIRFGTVGARIDGREVEITTYRSESYDAQSRKPEVAFGSNLADDLARRDFTMNAMATTAAAAGAAADAAHPPVGEGERGGPGGQLAAHEYAEVHDALAEGEPDAALVPLLADARAPGGRPSAAAAWQKTTLSSSASTSIVALSVSISARMSPEETSSPSLTSHLASVPSSIVGDRAGMRISVGMIRSLPVGD